MITAIALSALSAFLNALANFFLKRLSGTFSFRPAALLDRNLLLAAGCFICALSVYLSALMLADLSAIYPVTATQYIWIIILGRRLGEKISSERAVGVVLIMAGVILVGLSVP